MANEAIKLENELNIKFRIKPKSPLLVKSSIGKEETSESIITWLLKEEGKGAEKPYIPGSTLKGMFRERFTSIYYDYLEIDKEKIDDTKRKLESAREEEAEKNIGRSEEKKLYKEAGKDVFGKFQEVMEEKYKDKDDKSIVYKDSLLIEKLFGSKVLKGRFHTSDALIEGDYSPLEYNKYKEKVSGVARSVTPIDRFTGGAIVPLNFEYTMNDFIFDMKIKNITRNELKYLMFIIRDSQNGEVRVGSSKTRGFGEIELVVDELSIKKYNKASLEVGFDKYFNIDEKRSIKIGEKYLVENYILDSRYNKVDGKNTFIMEVVE